MRPIEDQFKNFPSEWDIKKVCDVCEKPQYGYTASATTESVGPKLLRITDINFSGVNWQSVPFCECSSEQFKKYELHRKDLLFARIGATTGKSFIVNDPPSAVFASYLIRLRANSNTCPEFLYYYFQSSFYWEQINANKDKNLKGGINASVLSGLEVIYPPLSEQQKIAAILFKIQKAIEIQEQIIETARELKKSTMQHVFTYGLRGEKPKETEIGRIPKSWDCKTLNEALLIAQYGLSVKGQSKGKYPILRMNCQIDGKVILNDLQYIDLDDETFKKFQLIDGDILFNRTNSHDLVGRTAIYHSDRDAVFASYLIRLRLDVKIINSDFLNYFFNMDSTQNKLKILASRGVSQSNISASKLKIFHIPVPSLEEQEEIVNVLNSIDKKNEMHIAKKSALQDLFRTMLNKLITGEIRVKDLKIDLNTLETS